MDEYTITGPSVTVPPKPGSRVKWLLVVLFAFIVFAGAMIGGYYLTHSDTPFFTYYVSKIMLTVSIANRNCGSP